MRLLTAHEIIDHERTATRASSRCASQHRDDGQDKVDRKEFM